jgi:hypothetical protein
MARMSNHLNFRAAFAAILLSFSLAFSASINSVQTIIDDMTLPPDARPHGVPDNYDWSSGAATQPGQFGSSAGMYAATTWGQLYIPREGNPASNTRAQIRNEAMYALSNADGKWHQVQYSESVQGAAFVEDFANNASKASDARTEPTGGISVTAGGGYNFHFWPYGARASIDPNDLKALYATVQARLIVDDPGKPDDRNIAKYILQLGGDYWKDQNVGWSADWSNNHGIGAGRFKWVTSTWQCFNMLTLVPFTDIRQNPPPLDSDGIETSIVSSHPGGLSSRDGGARWFSLSHCMLTVTGLPGMYGSPAILDMRGGAAAYDIRGRRIALTGQLDDRCVIIRAAGLAQR